MHRKFLAMTIAVAAFALPGLAQDSKLNGTWKLNPSKSSFGQFPPPTSETDTLTVNGNDFKQQWGLQLEQHLPESFGDGIAKSGSHGSRGFNSDGRPDDLTQPTGPAHQYQSDGHWVHRHRNDRVGAASGGNGQRCCALLSQWRRRQHASTLGSWRSGQPTAVRPQYNDAPKLR